jgi:hypothetical protein
VKRSQIIWITVILATATVARGAHAESRAEALFHEGVSLLEQKRVAEACSKLQESQQLEAAPGTLLNLADCYEQNGQTASAWAAYREVARWTIARPEWRDLAHERAAALAKRLATLSIVLAPTEGTTEVKRDGVVVPAEELGRPIPIDPGIHEVSATEAAKQPWARRIEVVGEGASVILEVPRLADQVPDRAQPTSTAGTNPGSGARTIGFVLAGTGAAAVTLGGIAGALAISKRSDAASQCADYPSRCSAQGVSVNASAQAWATASTVSVGVGVAVVAAGIVLILTAPTRTVAITQTWLAFAPTGWGGTF